MTTPKELANSNPTIQTGHGWASFPPETDGNTIATIFETQVRRYPQRNAVETNQTTLTYEALNRADNRLARAIVDKTRDQRPIAILLEHDSPAVVALIGALKAAKIFVLLDPALPPARLARILDDSGAQLIVTNDRCAKIAAALPQPAEALINLDRLEDDDATADDNLQRPVALDSVAYIIYTSGSTGVPKGGHAHPP